MCVSGGMGGWVGVGVSLHFDEGRACVLERVMSALHVCCRVFSLNVCV